MSLLQKTILALVILCLLFGVYVFRSVLFWQFFRKASAEEMRTSKVQIIAHRGASGDAPENTLAAIRKALEIGVDLVEIDVHSSADGKVLVFHDVTLERTTNGSGFVGQKPWETLSKLDAGSWFSADYAGEKIPLLSDVLALFRRHHHTKNSRTKLLIEFKDNEKGTVYPTLVSETIALLLVHDAQNAPWCVLQAFNTAYLEEAKNRLKNESYSPEIQKLIVADYAPFPTYTDTKFRWGYFRPPPTTTAVNPYYRSLTAAKVAALHKKNRKVFTYTVNQPEDMKKLIAMQVDGIITDYPARLKQLLNPQ